MEPKSNSNAMKDVLKKAIIEVEKFRTKAESLEADAHEPIAVIGMGCRFPGACDGPEAFWDFLRAGKSAVSEMPGDRWDVESFYHPDRDERGRIYTRHGNYLKDVAGFDRGFFRISAGEAERMDPQHRLLLETAWEACEHAGVDPARLRNTSTGVFIGVMNQDYTQHMLGDINMHTGAGMGVGVAAGRLAHNFGLKGPALALDTTCSSSLVAVHLACQSLRRKECGSALAGGVNLILSPHMEVILCSANMLAGDGRCKTFDAAADGYGRGEGCGVVFLKRLSDARRDGDRIFAVIRGSAINHDGPSSALPVPSGPAQEGVIRKALEDAGVDAGSIGYVEAHGTGTALGDPIEIEALQNVFGPGRAPGGPLLVGSVKTNVGHLEGAAGMASLIKAILAVSTGEIPPHLNFREPSPHIPWDGLSIRIPGSLQPWPAQGAPRRAGVSGFGFSGTNAHLVLEEVVEKATEKAPEEVPEEVPEEAPAAESAPPKTDRKGHILALSALTESALRESARRYLALLLSADESALAEICYTAAIGRSRFPKRAAFLGRDLEGIRDALKDFIQGKESPAWVSGASQGDGKVAFLFTGQGSQYAGMGSRLYADEPVFRAAMDRCAAILDARLDKPLLSLLWGADTASLSHTRYTQPALFAVEYSLTRLLSGWGLEPQAVLGHSVGEYVAAVTAGILSLEDGLELIAARGRLMETHCRKGKMLSVFAPYEKVAAAAAPYAGRLSVAARNAPRQVVVSGDLEAVETFAAALDKENISAHILPVSYAFHSELMEPMLEPFRQAAAGVAYHPPRIPFISNLNGTVIGEDVLDAGYWVEHVRGTVRFQEGIEAVMRENCRIMIEIGPKPILWELARLCLAGREASQISTLTGSEDSTMALLKTLAIAYVDGASPEWSRFYAGQSLRKCTVPTYPFERQRYWVKGAQAPLAPFSAAAAAAAVPPDSRIAPWLDRRLAVAGSDAWYFESVIGPERPGYLADHKVAGRVILPGSAYVEMALEAARAIPETAGLGLADMRFLHALELKTEVRVQVQAVKAGTAAWTVSIWSAPMAGGDWRMHAAGRLAAREEAGTGSAVLPWTRAAGMGSEGAESVTAGSHYAGMAAKGLEYGPAFRCLKEAEKSGTNVSAGLALANGQAVNGEIASPRLLDTVFQSAGILCRDLISDTDRYLPVGFARLHLTRDMPEGFRVEGRLSQAAAMEAGELLCDFLLLDPSGTAFGELTGLKLKLAGGEPASSILHEINWQSSDADADADAIAKSARRAKAYYLIGDGDGILARAMEGGMIRGMESLPPKKAGKDWGGAAAAAVSALREHAGYVEADASPEPIVVLGLAPDPAEAAGDVPADPLPLLRDIQAFLAALAAAWDGEGALSVLVATRGAGLAGGDKLSLSHAGVTGMLLTAAREYPALRFSQIDLPVEAASADRLALAEFLARDSAWESQTAVRAGRCLVPRLRILAGPPSPPRAITLRSDAAYLVTGGTKGIGLATAVWLASKGARHLALAARTAPAGEEARILKSLSDSGVDVRFYPADMGNLSEARDLIGRIGADLPALKGIIHAAGVTADGPLETMTGEQWDRVMAPKALGAWSLHASTQGMPLDFFVLYSSVASVLGNRGQANYSAANSVLDALARFRSGLGLPALSINWGPWAETGMANRRGLVSGMEKSGMRALRNDRGLEALETLMGSGMPQALAADADWHAYVAASGSRPDPLRSLVAAAPDAGIDAQAFRNAMEACAGGSQDQAVASIIDALRIMVGQVTALGAEDMDSPSRPFAQCELGLLGLDSLKAMELRDKLRVALGVTLPLHDLLGDKKVAEIAMMIYEKALFRNLSAVDASGADTNLETETITL